MTMIPAKKNEPWAPCSNCGANPWVCVCSKPDYSRAIAQVRRVGMGTWVVLSGGRHILENRPSTIAERKVIAKIPYVHELQKATK